MDGVIKLACNETCYCREVYIDFEKKYIKSRTILSA